MDYVDIQFKGAKETHEIGVAVKGVIAAYKQAVADGWQAGTDIPAILMASYGKLTDAIDGANKIGDEFKGEPVKAAMGMLVPLAQGVELLIEKDEPTE